MGAVCWCQRKFLIHVYVLFLCLIHFCGKMNLFYNTIRLHCGSFTESTVTDICYVVTVCLLEVFTGLYLACVFLASAGREVSVYFMFSSAKGLENIFIFCCGTLYVCLHKPIILSLGFNLSPAFSSYVYKSSTSTRNKSCIHNYFTGGSRTMKL